MNGMENKSIKIMCGETEGKDCQKQYFRDIYGNYSDVYENRIEINSINVEFKI